MSARLCSVALLGSLLMGSATLAHAGELGAAEAREFRASKLNAPKCRQVVLKEAKKTFPKDTKMASQLAKKSIEEITDYCGKEWHKGCIVVYRSSSECRFTPVDEETRLDKGKIKVFPKDFTD